MLIACHLLLVIRILHLHHLKRLPLSMFPLKCCLHLGVQLSHALIVTKMVTPTHIACFLGNNSSGRSSSPPENDPTSRNVPSKQFSGHSRPKPSSPGRRVHFYSSAPTRHMCSPSPAPRPRMPLQCLVRFHSSDQTRYTCSPSPAPRPGMSLERPSKFCLVHGPSNHMTEECFKILEWQQEQVVTTSLSNFQSRQTERGED